MKVVVAMDSFKGSMDSLEAGEAIRQGIERVYPEAEVWVRPLADGGEGTVTALAQGLGGRLEQVDVTGPLGEKVTCTYGILAEKNTAVLEMSGAAGITLVEENKRNPLLTTTFGVGEVILDAMQKGCRHFIVGIGGSATNDGGVGMLQALGYEFLDAEGNSIPLGANGLSKLDQIRTDHVCPELEECDFRIACDVTNPLCGENGCSAVFSPQKGAPTAMVQDMDQWLANYAKLSQELYPKANPEQPGTGAAGGLGFAFLTYTDAKLESGVQIVLEQTRLEQYIQEADMVVTGEGRLDAQTVMGKAPIGVAALAKKHGKKVLAFAGSVAEDAVKCNEYGIDAYFPILRTVGSLEDAMKSENAKNNMSATVEQVFRLIRDFS